MPRLAGIVETDDRDIAANDESATRRRQHRADGYDIVVTNHGSRPVAQSKHRAHRTKAAVARRHALEVERGVDRNSRALHGRDKTLMSLLPNHHGVHAAQVGDSLVAKVDEMAGDSSGTGHIVRLDEAGIAARQTAECDEQRGISRLRGFKMLRARV